MNRKAKLPPLLAAFAKLAESAVSHKPTPKAERRAAVPSPAAARSKGPEGEFSEAALQDAARKMLVALGCETLARTVKVRWNSRLRTTAGLACYAKGLVSLNPSLVPFGMPEVDRTLRHELAHLLARFRAGRRRIQPHGAEWQQACVDLGLADEKRCHELPLPRTRIQPKLLYRCRNCLAEVRRVRPFKRPVACLKCCKSYNHGRFDEKYRFVKVG